MSHQSSNTSTLIEPFLQQTSRGENVITSDDDDNDTNDIVGASVNFALKRASEAAVWYKQKNFDNGGEWSEGRLSYQHPYSRAVAPGNLEPNSPLRAAFNQPTPSNSEMNNQFYAPSLSSESSLEEKDASQFQQSKSRPQASSGYSEDYTRSITRKKRRRKSDALDPNSSRARYLEKNREAASRCRRNQKKKTENLIETARTMEEKNKFLRVEVACLKEDMASLMDVVASHSNCPDGRLHKYVQREADRLADGRRTSFRDPTQGSTPSPSSSETYNSRREDLFAPI